jgi:hypothetical protein
MKTAIVVLCFVFAAVQAFPPPPFRQMRPPPMLPGFDLLPAEVQAKLKSVMEDPTLGFQERHEKIIEIMENLPDEVKSKLPPPPGFEKLPVDVQEKLKAIHMDRTLTWRQKHDKIREIIDNLPEDVKRLLPIPPPPPGFEHLPEDVKMKLRAVHEDKSLSHRDRMQKVHEIIDSLPADIKAKLPPPPPMPPMGPGPMIRPMSRIGK